MSRINIIDDDLVLCAKSIRGRCTARKANTELFVDRQGRMFTRAEGSGTDRFPPSYFVGTYTPDVDTDVILGDLADRRREIAG